MSVRKNALEPITENINHRLASMPVEHIQTALINTPNLVLGLLTDVNASKIDPDVFLKIQKIMTKKLFENYDI